MGGAVQAGSGAAPAAHETASMDATSNWPRLAAVVAVESAVESAGCAVAGDYASRCDAPFQLRMQRPQPDCSTSAKDSRRSSNTAAYCKLPAIQQKNENILGYCCYPRQQRRLLSCCTYLATSRPGDGNSARACAATGSSAVIAALLLDPSAIMAIPTEKPRQRKKGRKSLAIRFPTPDVCMEAFHASRQGWRKVIFHVTSSLYLSLSPGNEPDTKKNNEDLRDK